MNGTQKSVLNNSTHWGWNIGDNKKTNERAVAIGGRGRIKRERESERRRERERERGADHMERNGSKKSIPTHQME